jgi:hypothetical protein
MGTLLPWNFFISVNSFWDYKFRNVTATGSGAAKDVQDLGAANTDEERTDMQKDFFAYLAIASNVPNAIFVIVNAAYGQRFPFTRRVIYSSAVVIVLFVAMTALSYTNSDDWQKEFMGLVLALVVVINCATAIFQASRELPV